MEKLRTGVNMRQIMDRFQVRIDRTLFVAALALSVSVVNVQSQECSPPEVIEAVRNVKMQSAHTPLNVVELPNLRERVLGLQEENHANGAYLQTVRFYKITPAIYEIVDRRIVSTTVQLDNESVWIVGLDPSKNSYKLSGFPNSVSEFNRLMQDLAIRVRTSEDALSVFDAFLRLARTQEFFSSIVADVMQLQSAALQDFRLRFPESKRNAAFKKWWRAIPPQTRVRIAVPTVRSRESNFEVVYYRYTEGVIKEESVLISSEAAVTPRELSKVLYSNGRLGWHRSKIHHQRTGHPAYSYQFQTTESSSWSDQDLLNASASNVYQKHGERLSNGMGELRPKDFKRSDPKKTLLCELPVCTFGPAPK